MSTANDTTSQQYPVEDFVYVERAAGSVKNRGQVLPLQEATFQEGATDCYLSYYRFAPDLKDWVETHTNQNGKPSVAGFAGPVWADRFAADFDSEDEVAAAQRDAITFCERLIAVAVPLDAIRIYFSGKKGFHVELDAGWFGGFEPSVELPSRTKGLAVDLLDELPTADLSLYDRTQLVRAPHTVHGKTGKFKIPLSIDELRLPVPEIQRLAEHDRPDPTCVADVVPLDALVTRWAEARAKGRKREPWPGADEVFEDQRNSTLTRFAGAMRHRGMTGPEILAALGQMNIDRCRPPLPDDEVEYIASGMLRYDPEDDRTERTDLGNARRLLALFGSDWRHDVSRRVDFHWDGTRWAEDDTGVLQRCAHTITEVIRDEAAAITDNAEAKEHLVWARRSQHVARIDAMVKVAHTLPGVATRVGEFDRHPMLLNVPNGTLDLETGELGPHRREHLLTKPVPVEYDATATCPTWLGFLDRVMGGRADLVEYLKRVAGYVLTGETRGECLFFFYGDGSNGKSTFIETLVALLGPDYARKTPTATLMRKKGDRIPNDLARLPGSRLVVASEIQQGGHLDEALIKDLTGRDTIAARFLHKEFFEFVPSFKLVMYGNHRPRISGTDAGIWRRVKLVPFTQTISDAEKDEHLREKLRTELPGILAWAVEGCRAWLADGLAEPEVVRGATEEYRQEMDLVAAFLAECCDMGSDTKSRKVLGNDLYRAYRNWAGGQGAFALSNQEFGQELTKRGVGKLKSNGKVWRTGLGLTSHGEGFVHGPGGTHEATVFDFRDGRTPA